MYTQPIDRSHPGCIIFLVDQSGSMGDPFAGTAQSKAVSLAQAVNRLIRNLVLQCQRGESIRDYYHLGIIGYGNVVQSAFGGPLKGYNLVPISNVASLPLRMVTEAVPGEPDLSIEMPIWLEPLAAGGTPMMGAIDFAGALAVQWANDHFDSFPPIVINMSDGESTDEDPRAMAIQLRDVHTRDGNLLFFNVNLSESGAMPMSFVSDPLGLPDKYAMTLFEMSSELTPYMTAVARGMGFTPLPGARGFMFNADPTSLGEFLDVGTRVSQVNDR